MKCFVLTLWDVDALLDVSSVGREKEQCQEMPLAIHSITYRVVHQVMDNHLVTLD